MAAADVKKISYSIQEAAAATGLSQSFLDAAIRSGSLRARQTRQDPQTGKTLGKRLIRAGDLEAFIDALPVADAS